MELAVFKSEDSQAERIQVPAVAEPFFENGDPVLTKELVTVLLRQHFGSLPSEMSTWRVEVLDENGRFRSQIKVITDLDPHLDLLSQNELLTLLASPFGKKRQDAA